MAKTWYAPLPKLEYSHNWMHLLATIDILEKIGTHMVKNESSSEGTVVLLRMINLVKHYKKLNSALPIKSNLQHVKRRNVLATPSYTTTNTRDDGVNFGKLYTALGSCFCKSLKVVQLPFLSWA